MTETILRLPTLPTGEKARAVIDTVGTPVGNPEWQATRVDVDPTAEGWAAGTWDGTTAISPALSTLGIDADGTWVMYVRWDLSGEPDIVRSPGIIIVG